MAESYHEPPETLSAETLDVHRALATVIEELQAVDWYHQRWEAATDPSLKDVIIHNRNEEIEHATMGLEWLRRRMPEFDEQFRTYLFTSRPITEVEEAAEAAEGAKETGMDLGLWRSQRK